MKRRATIIECDYCHNAFLPSREWQRFCCPEHRVAWHQEAHDPGELKRIITSLLEQIKELEDVIIHYQGKLNQKGRDIADLRAEYRRETRKPAPPAPFSIEFIRSIVDS